MTKKDYESIAAIFARIDCNHETDSDLYDEGHTTAMRDMAYELCTVFQRDDPRFDRRRFLKSCGIE